MFKLFINNTPQTAIRNFEENIQISEIVELGAVSEITFGSPGSEVEGNRSYWRRD